MDKLVETILSYPKLQERLKGRADENKRVHKLIEEIRGSFNPALVKTGIRLLDSTFGRLYDGVNLEVPRDMDFKQLTLDNHVVLVPNHQSHADYIALTYVIFGVYEIPLYIAGGINLNIFPIGQLFRKTGAFFIRRSFGQDILYRLTFEAYIYYLLSEGMVVEFFFEGGRSRTGKLLRPRFGLFQMLLEAHSQLKDGKPLLFIPVTLAHEQVPEERSHAKELGGGRKSKEKSTQLLKLFKLFNKRLGTIHVKLSPGFRVSSVTDVKQTAHDVAFYCFRAIGKAMPVTPTSLLALILLDEPSGAMNWKSIEERAGQILQYCQRFAIPLTYSLEEEQWRESLRQALELFLANHKVVVWEREKLGEIFYAIRSEERVALNYFKNMILHHFIVPAIINLTWFNVSNGKIKSVQELNSFLLEKRKELKYEFYLPSVKEMLAQAVEVMSWGTGKKIGGLEEGLTLTQEEQYALASRVKMFASAFAYLYEVYYLGALAIKYLASETFDSERFVQVAKELFEMELAHGKMIKYRESYTMPILKNTLSYYEHMRVLQKEASTYRVVNLAKLQELLDKFASDLTDQLSLNVRFNQVL